MLLLAAIALAVCAAQPEDQPNLVLISMDTTRADALSCYPGTLPGISPKPDTTPHLCALAAEGARFERFWIHAPTTLSSHTTMLTGMDPHRHGVPRNGFTVDPSLPTLAQRLSAAGWDTIAVLGSAALESEMGLDRGFRVYDDELSEQLGVMFQDRAQGVLERTERAVDQRQAHKPLFLFAHFFDPHTPYRAPEPWRERFADPSYAGPYHGDEFTLGRLHRDLERGREDPADVAQVSALYLGEVAYVDQVIGQLLDYLKAEGLLEHAVVAVVADHGEVLSELPKVAFSHGTDVTEMSTHVPLIIRGYGVPLAEGAVVHRQATMDGLASTLEMSLGLEPTLGTPFWELVRPGPVLDTDGWPERPTRTARVEATRPRHYERTDSWNNLSLFRALHAGGWGIEAAPFLERGPRLVHGPGLIREQDSALIPLLAAELSAWDAAAPPFREVHRAPETEEALRALGYLEPE